MTNWHALLAEWQPILELQDRPIALLIVPARKIGGDDAQVCFTNRDATEWQIKVRQGEHKDAETTLVHELLHIRTGRMDPLDEANLWAIARALVRLRHETP